MKRAKPDALLLVHETRMGNMTMHDLDSLQLVTGRTSHDYAYKKKKTEAPIKAVKRLRFNPKSAIV